MRKQSNDHILLFLQPFVNFASKVVTGVGLLVLFGWVFDIPFLKSIIPNAATMSFNTAVCFILAGISLYLLHNETNSPTQKRIGQIIAGFILLVGIFTSAEYLFGWDLGIDQLFMRDLDTAPSEFPGRMAPITANCFVFVSLALLLIETKISQYFSLTVIVLSLLAIIGYMFDYQALYELWRFHSIALHTALTLFILSLAVIVSRPSYGLIKALTSKLRGTRMTGLLLPITIVLIVVLGWLAEAGQNSGLLNADTESVIFAGVLIFVLAPVIFFFINRVNQAEEVLSASEAQLRATFEQAAVGIAQVALDGHWLKVNQRLCDIVGYTREEMFTKTFQDITHPDDLNADLEYVRQVLANEIKTYSMEKRYLRKDGSIIWINLTVSLVHDASGEPEYFIAVVEDITERKQAERQVLQMKRLYATLSQVNQTIVRDKSPEKLYQSICDVALRFGELTLAWIGLLDEVTGDIRPVAVSGLNVTIDKWPLPILNIHQKPSLNGVITDAMHTSNTVTSEDVQTDERTTALREMVQKFGFHSLAAVPFRLRGKTTGILVMISVERGVFNAPEEQNLLDEMGLDISFALDTMKTEAEHKQAEEKLSVSELSYRRLFESAKDGILILDAETGMVVDVNPSLITLLGYSKETFLGKRLWELGFFKDIAANKANFLELQEQEYIRYEDLPLETAHGRNIHVEFVSNVYKVNDQKVIQCNIRDITERKKVELELQESEKQFSTVFFTNPVSQSILSQTTGLIIEVNDACCNLYGYSRAEILGAEPGQLDLWANPADQLPILDELQRTGHVLPTEVIIRKKSGEIHTVLFTVEPISWKGIPCILTSSMDITARKQAEEALSRERELLHILVDNLPQEVYVKDRERRFLLANAFVMRALSAQRMEDIIGKRDDDFMPPSLAKQFADEEDELMDLDKPLINDEHSPTHKPGPKQWYLRTKIPFHDEAGNVLGLIGIGNDITERKQAEEKIRESQELFRSLFEYANDAIFLISPEGVHIEANQKAVEMLGYERDELIGMIVKDIVAPHEYSAATSMMADLLGGKSMPLYERIFRKKNGVEFPVEVNIALIHDMEDKPLYIQSIVRDITERKRAENSIRLAEQQYRLLFEESPVMVVLTEYNDTDIFIAKCNQEFLSTLGYDQAEVIGKSLTGFYGTDSRVKLEQSYSRTISGIPLSEERELITRDGRIVPVLMRAVPRANAEGVVIGTQASYIDITERKRAETQIQNKLQHLNSLRIIDTAISSSFDIHVTLDIVLQQVLSQLGVDAAAILLINPEMQTIEYAASRGFRSNALHHTQLQLSEGYAGRAVHERKTIYIPALLEKGGKLAEAMRSANEDFVDYYGIPLISKDGIKGVLEIYHRSPLQPDPDWLDFLETLAGQAAIAIDNAQLFDSLQRSNADLEQRVAQRTAELNQTNLELEHANRTKDEFLATMSHELRTPLNSILGLSETLLEQKRDPLSAHQQRSLQIIATSGQHLLELINDILDLSKIEAGKFEHHPQMIGVDDLCRSSLTLVKEQATRKSITLTYQQDTTISKMYADPRRLKQILVNLLTNAVKFTPDNGQILLQVHGSVEQGRIQFSVIDTGIGIALKDLRLLFVPFSQVDSSLTRQYEGTGLGLALVQKLTDLHGGSVDVESDGVPGKGSRFTINLPIGDVAQPGTLETADPLLGSKPAEKIKAPGSSKLILLAEDNMANILTIGDYLEGHEYQVVVAHDGLSAIEMAEAHQPDIILMDIQMPVLDGLEAIRRLRALPRFAATPIIALTALAMSGDRERCLEAGANEYISKPASLKGLVKSINKLLGKEE